jgi:hypothetical protein
VRILAMAELTCPATRASAAVADREANKALTRSYIEEVFNKRQPCAADSWASPFVRDSDRVGSHFLEAKANSHHWIDIVAIEEAVPQSALDLLVHDSRISIKLLRKLPIDRK